MGKSQSESQYEVDLKYKDALKEIAVMHDRIELMEKWREDVLNENEGLYTKLNGKDSEITSLT